MKGEFPTVQPIELPGDIIDDPAELESLDPPASPAEVAEFNKAMEEIREAERRAWQETQGIILG